MIPWLVIAAAIVAGMFSALPIVVGHVAAGVARKIRKERK